MIESIIVSVLHFWPAIFCVFLVAYGFNRYYSNGLNKYPGPALAKVTDLWRFIDVLGRRPDITQLKLHRQHGNVVRLGPKVLTFSSPKALKTIYGLNKGFTKSGFYPPQQASSNGQRLPSLFSTTDEAYHATLRRCVNNAFSMSALVQYEPQVNETVDVFLKKTEEFYISGVKGKVCDFAEWLQFFAFDVIGQITYSKPHGFIEHNKDIDGMVTYLGRLFGYVAPVGQMPWLDLLLLKNPILLWLDKLGFKPLAFPITTFAKARMAEKLSINKAEKSAEDQSQRGDLLTMFLKAKADRPDFMTDQRVLTMAVSMAFAGSETTAISLAALFYYLLKDKEGRYEKLMLELDGAIENGTIEKRKNGTITWTESQTLPYLDACIKEAFRVHPAAGLPLERITPPQGIEIDGEFIPGGTTVGCNAWVIHKDRTVFGQHYDVDAFVPERWLEASPAQLKEMNGTMFQFGAGARTCIGKNISLLEIYKLVPAFLLRFKIELEHPEKEWKLFNAWFVKQHDFKVTFQKR